MHSDERRLRRTQQPSQSTALLSAFAAQSRRHAPLRAFVRKLLLDWPFIMRQVGEPHLPLTNNEAERALPHHVISRRISHGTRTPQGSRGYALLAMVLAGTNHAARKGLPLPCLPPIPVTSGGGV